MQITFPENLPINQRREEIAELIQRNQIVVVAGETGSGKTTQLPKICLSLGLAEQGLIGHTQPRRIAARTVADRIADELKVSLGNEVGYQVRFNDNSNEHTKLKLMTDGVLLAEMQHDRLLKKYQVIIIDEAHERSLNIDFLLGLLKPICRKRPELKVIITSATIDLEKFARHFSINGRTAPIIEVSGRTFPVETVYQPIENDTQSLADTISNTVQHIARAEAKGDYKASGDILVFCAGEREIRDAAQAIRRAQLPVEVLPLYSRLSVQEQNKIFKPAHRRKVVLATNVAETSITVPGIAYVVDPGLARISRYSFRSKIQRLPIEPISQASANQRQGRCGRVANGVCIRLYSQEDYAQRPEFTQAEILRSNLASVILKMMRLGIKDVSRFDFIDQPDSRLLNDGHKLLQELQAIEKIKHRHSDQSVNRLTDIGRQMSDLPVDPRFARILVAANSLDCLRDALVLISVLSIQDPRERPNEHQQAANQKHKELQHTQSDFYGFLYLWQSINNHRSELSNTKFKQHCLTQFWSIARIFEWRELVRQLGQMCKQQGWSVGPWQTLELPSPESQKQAKKTPQGFDTRYARLHQALICGLLDNIASKDIDGEYLATRGRRIHLFPSSSQAKRKPGWLVAGEYLETSRVFAINVASINPSWVIESARHLVKYSYSSPHYHVRSGAVKAYRKTLLQGLTLKDKEAINYAPISPSESRQVFIQEALVAGKYQPRANKAEFVAHNKTLIADIEKIEAKTRRRNLLVSDQEIYAFYQERLPEFICNRTSLEKWLANGNQAALKLNKNQVLATEVDDAQIAQFPNHLEVQHKRVEIKYSFNPGQSNDGVTALVPISVLAPFPDHIGEWLVPGLLREKCIALIKTLPKTIRKHYAPASDVVDRVLPKLRTAEQSLPLCHALADILYRTRGTKVTAADFDLVKLDHYYLMNYRVIDVDGSLVDEGRDLAKLKREYANKVQASVHATNSTERKKLEQHNLQDWSIGTLSESVQYQHQGMTVQAFPALKSSDDNSIDLLVFDRQDHAHYHHHFGVLSLAKQVLSTGTQKQAYNALQKELMRPKTRAPVNTKQGLGQLATQLKKATPKLTTDDSWVGTIIDSALSQSCFDGQPEHIRNHNDFQTALTKAKQWVPIATHIETALIHALTGREIIFKRLQDTPALTVKTDTAYEDIKAQLYRLFEPSLLSVTSLAQLQQYPRYLRAIESRLDKVALNWQSPDELALTAQQARFEQFCCEHQASQFDGSYLFIIKPHLKQFAILLEEWRVSIYAQHLRTQQPVSDKRLNTYWHTYIDIAG